MHTNLNFKNAFEFYREVDLHSLDSWKKYEYDTLRSSMSPNMYGYASKKFDWNIEEFGDLYVECEKLFSKFNLSVMHVRVFLTPPNAIFRAHIDGHKLSSSYYAFNIPLSVAPIDHYMEWYDYDGALTKMHNEYNNSLYPQDNSKLVLEERLCLTKPAFVKIGTMHAVVNNSNQERTVLSIRFRDSFV